jgi:hypothetical protein
MAKSPREVNDEILSQLDIAGEYAALGVRTSGNPRASGMVACYAHGREDRKPSAWINIKTGYYGDSGGKDAEAYSCSLWDFAVRVGRFADWQEARKAYAQKAGVKIGRVKGAGKGDWRERLELLEWDRPGRDAIAQGWCIRKPGATLAAIKAAGGRLGMYPCYRDKKTKELKRTMHASAVVAFPCYGKWLLDGDPAAWVVYKTSGQPFDVTPRDHPGERIYAKNVSVGPTSGTLCGLSSLMVLCDPERREKITLVWKVEGIPDLLTVWSVIPEGERDQVAVITQAGGATADVWPHQSEILAGLRVAVIGDADEAGRVGAEKWLRALHGVAGSVWDANLPFEILPKGGQDVRDFLTEGGSDARNET